MFAEIIKFVLRTSGFASSHRLNFSPNAKERMLRPPGEEAMIFRRLSVNLRRQNWTAIAIEFILLVLGVYLGLLAFTLA